MHQSQSLSLQQVLAPQLQQSLLILQAPLLELRNLVQQEMETNPVLEELANETEEQQKTEEKKSTSSDDEFKAEFDQLAKLDEEWRDYMAQSSSYSGRSQEADDKRQFFFDSIATQETLQQHLMGQLNQTALNGDDRKTAELIIGNIDDNGFLQTNPEEMALNTGIAQDEFEHMLTLIQSFYPPGVGARDLRECLLIQLRREGEGQQPRIQDGFRAHGRPRETPVPGNRAPNGNQRRAGAEVREQYRASSIRGRAPSLPRLRKTTSCPM